MTEMMRPTGIRTTAAASRTRSMRRSRRPHLTSIWTVLLRIGRRRTCRTAARQRLDALEDRTRDLAARIRDGLPPG